jgi:uncharacterized damage-inducible protein DinB
VKLTQLLLDELDREALRTRKALEQVPAGRDDWKPHDKSMALGRLAGMIAGMPGWIALIINAPELDVAPAGGGQMPLPGHSALLSTLDGSLDNARKAIAAATDDFLFTTKWRLLAGGNVVAEQPRHIFVRDAINHLAHHRGQLTVYLRLLNAKVPALYGPSADDQQFG